MSERTPVPALGAEGWFSLGDRPSLIGSVCATCGTFAFPRRTGLCPSPHCRGEAMNDVELSRQGTLWSYTDAQYQPPPPFIFDGDTFEPFAIAAVELEAEGIVVLGQVVPGVAVDELTVGTAMELVVGTLYSDDDHDYQVWRWQPIETSEATR